MNFDNFEIKSEPERPPIYITSPENSNMTNLFLNQLSSQHQIPQRPSAPLTVNTNLSGHTSSGQNSPHGQSPNRSNILNIQLPANPFLGNQILPNQVQPLSPNSFTSF